jgi:hypothetical protein
MADLVKEMQAAGLLHATTSASGASVPAASFQNQSLELDFSGYGAFTPITVGSSTVFGSANLERDKQRD